MNRSAASPISITDHLTYLADHIGPRPTGSPGNQQAGEYIRDQFARHGWHVETQPFDCLTWEDGGAHLVQNGHELPVQANPYSLPYEGSCPFVVCASVSELESHHDLRGHFVVLTGELTTEPYMPRNFPFFTIDEQLHILRLLDDLQPDAIIAIHDGPIFCDADFHMSSVTITEEAASTLLANPDSSIDLSIRSAIIPSTGFNVVARSNNRTDPTIVVCAHYDTWFNTPGATDNAGGVTALLGLAQVLDRNLPVEIVAFNGEDHYASPGQVTYLHQTAAGSPFVINIDGVGVVGRQNSVSFWGDDAELFAAVRAAQADFPNLVEVEPWPQGDHMIFVQRGIPAVALSSVFDDWLAKTHTPADTLDQIDPAQIDEVIAFVQRIVAG